MQQTIIDNRYKLVELLGSGGMAQVYLAHDEVLGRNVALKLLRGQYADDEEFVERFRQEARSAASLSHPNIISIYDQGRSEDGAYYMAMEYVPGGTLKERIISVGALAPGVAAGVALQIAEALSEAHQKGVVHRDIKPQNVLVTRTGDIKVTDFGIARAASAATMTRTGSVLGTAGYMSPEQARGEPVGPPSDLYSLGVVLYEMLTGNLPYEADSAIAQAVKHISEPPPSPREANPEVPEDLDALTTRLLAKNPSERYPSAASASGELDRVLSGGRTSRAYGPSLEKARTGALLPPAKSVRGERRQGPAPSVRTAPATGGSAGNRGFVGRISGVLGALLIVVAMLGGLVWALQYLDTSSLREFLDNTGGGNQGAGSVLVPDLVDASTAAADLASAGLVLGRRSDVPNDVVPAGLVVYSVPQEGLEVETGTVVDIFVSTGPVQLPVPGTGASPGGVPAPAPVAPAQQPRDGRDQYEENTEFQGQPASTQSSVILPPYRSEIL